MWQPQIEALGEEYNVIAIDLPGHGSKQGQRFTLAAAVEAVDKAIDDSGTDKVLLVGLSLGGYVAMAYAAQHGGRVAGIFLSGCCVQYFGRIGWHARLVVLWLWFATQRRFEQLQRKILGHTIPTKYVDLMAEHGISLTGARSSFRSMIGVNYCRLLRQYSGPVMIVNGERDAINRQYQPALAACAPGCETAVIEDAGHVCNLEQADRFSGLVREFAQSTFSRDTAFRSIGEKENDEPTNADPKPTKTELRFLLWISVPILIIGTILILYISEDSRSRCERICAERGFKDYSFLPLNDINAEEECHCLTLEDTQLHDREPKGIRAW